MIDPIKNISFSDIENLIQAISKTEFALLDHITSQMQADLDFLQVLTKLKTELTKAVSVK